MFLPSKTALLSLFVVATALSGTMSAHAATLATRFNPSQFLNGTAPNVGNATLDNTGYVVCYDTFCSMDSAATKGAVWSAEHLTAQQVANARGASRKSMTFFSDPHIPAAASARTGDYTRSGYDRGHMAPWADSADPNCFTLANIVPQNPDNNRHLWEGIETSTREMASKYGEVYVVSGPIFEGKNSTRINGVVVPDGLYKAVYVPSMHVATAYVVRNAPGYWWKPVSINDVINMTHTDPFPALPASYKAQVTTPVYPNMHGKIIPPGDASETPENNNMTDSGHQSSYEQPMHNMAHTFMRHMERSAMYKLFGH